MLTLRSRPLFALLVASLACPVVSAAAEFDGCEDVFLSPVFLASHARRSVEARLGATVPTRVEIRAKIEAPPQEKPGKDKAGKDKQTKVEKATPAEMPEVVVSPPDIAGDVLPLAPLWPEKGVQGRWLPARPGNTIDLRVVTFPEGKETELAKFRIHLGKIFSETGYALFSLNDDRVFALHITASAWDGTRSCHGLQGHPRPRWSLPDNVVTAQPARAMFEAVRRSHGCASKGDVPECALGSYRVEYRDVDEDKAIDAVVLRVGADGLTSIEAIWMLDSKGTLGPAFEGHCDGDVVPLSPGRVRCLDGKRQTVIEFHKGRGKQRDGTGAELQILSGFSAAERAQEAVGNLRAVYLAEKMLHNSLHRYTDDWMELDYLPERGNYYSYYLAQQGPRQQRLGPDIAVQTTFRIIDGDRNAFPGLVVPAAVKVSCAFPTGKTGTATEARPGLAGTGPDHSFTAIAVSDLDGAGHLDCWSVSSAERTAPDGTKILAGDPFHHTAVTTSTDP